MAAGTGKSSTHPTQRHTTGPGHPQTGHTIRINDPRSAGIRRFTRWRPLPYRRRAPHRGDGDRCRSDRWGRQGLSLHVPLGPLVLVDHGLLVAAQPFLLVCVDCERVRAPLPPTVGQLLGQCPQGTAGKAPSDRSFGGPLCVSWDHRAPVRSVRYRFAPVRCFAQVRAGQFQGLDRLVDVPQRGGLRDTESGGELRERLVLPLHARRRRPGCLPAAPGTHPRPICSLCGHTWAVAWEKAGGAICWTGSSCGCARPVGSC